MGRMRVRYRSGVEEEFSMEDYVDLDDDYAMYAYRNDSRRRRPSSAWAKSVCPERRRRFSDSLLEQIRFRRFWIKKTVGVGGVYSGNLDAGWVFAPGFALVDRRHIIDARESIRWAYFEALHLVRTRAGRQGAVAAKECLLPEGCESAEQQLARRVLKVLR